MINWWSFNIDFSFVSGTDEIEMYGITQEPIYLPFILGLDLCHHFIY